MQKPTLDPTIRPQDDFFGYVNNIWLKEHPIPPSETRWGTFDVLRDASWRAVHEIVEELTAQDEQTLSVDQKTLKRFFESALTYDDHRDNHLKILRSEVDEIQSVQTPAELARVLGRLHRIALAPLFTEYVELDDKDSAMQVLRLHQAGLSLPNRDYYLENSERMNAIRSAYTSHIEAMQEQLPELLANTDLEKVVLFETSLAQASWTDVELRDVQKNYTKMTRAELQARYHTFDWTAFFEGLGWQEPNDHIVVDQPTFFDAALELLNTTPLDVSKAYLTWHVVNGFAAWIDASAATTNFEFYGRTLVGMKEQKPLWKRSVLLADTLIIGETLGREYAARHFPESSKHTVEAIVEEIRVAYHARIDALAWMNNATKQRAHVKLDNINVFIGYPSRWKDIGSLSFHADNVIDNILQARVLHATLDLAKIGTPPPEEEWYMNAHTVNAYNHPNRLEIVFPAAILQPPFFDPHASSATNLGGIGAVIGHEFTHSFDDQGAEFDENGNTHQWISDEELENFHAIAQHIVAQADVFETVPGTFLQGKLILGEAIADVGGLELAIEALKRTVDADALEHALKELFVSFATCECGATTVERAIELAKTDPHPPSPFRVNCVVCHVDDFYSTYHVEPTDALFVEKANRAQIW